jgi:hypothetical protein
MRQYETEKLTNQNSAISNQISLEMDGEPLFLEVEYLSSEVQSILYEFSRFSKPTLEETFFDSLTSFYLCSKVRGSL